MPAATVASVRAVPPSDVAPDSEEAATEDAAAGANPKSTDGGEPLAPTRTHVARDVALAVHVQRVDDPAPNAASTASPLALADVSLCVVPESELVFADEADFDPDTFLDDGDFERATTDAHGDAVLPRALEEHGIVVAKAKGFGVAAAAFDMEAQRGKALTLGLRPAQRLEGTVVRGWTEDPVVNARLFVRPFLSAERETTNLWARMHQLLRGVVVRTGPGGRFVTEALDFAEVTELTVVAEGFARHHCGDVVPEAGPRTVRLYDGRRGTGRVQRRDGRGIEGALVTVQVRGWFPFSETARTTSDADGAFELAVCPPGPIEVIATQRGFGRRRLRLDLDPLATPRFELVMDEEAKLAGSVVDDLGAPLDGATVDVFDDRDRIEVGAMRTQDGGLWWMYWVAPDVPLTLQASLAGHRPWQRDSLRAPLDELRIVLARNGALTGTVLARATAGADAERAPVERFRVRCIPVAAPRVEQRQVEAEPRLVSDRAGRFELADLWPGPAELLIEADGFAPVRKLVEVVAGATAPCEPIVLEAAASIAGRVRDEDGAPIAGATVELALAASDGAWRMDEGTATARCDATGAFTLGVPPSGFSLVVTTQDGARHPFVELAPADFPRDLVLPSGGAIEGVVRPPWRFADSTCYVFVRRPGTEVGFGLAPERRGRFRFGGLDPGEWIVELFDDATLFETHQSDGYVGRRVVVVAGETTTVELSSAGRGVLRGRVDAHGLELPLDALNVMVASDDATAPPLLARAAVEPSGAFAFGALAPGAYRVELTANLRGVALVGTARAELVLPACSAEVVVPIEGVSVIGRVVGPDRATLAATVLLETTEGRELARVRARDDGGFTIHGAPRGDALLHAFAPDCADRRTTLHVGASAAPLELHLDRAARLTVRVLRSGDGAPPLADLDVRVVGVDARPAARADYTARTSADGIAEFLRLPSEELRVVVGDRRSPAAERTLRLTSGETETLELHVDHLAAIEATISSVNGGAGRRRVTCIGPLPDESAARRRATTDEEGRCRFDGLLAGRYLVVADADAKGVASATVEARADVVTECALTRSAETGSR